MKALPTESGVGVMAGKGKAFVVRVRRDWPVKPEAEQVDGKEWIFRFGWRITEEDSLRYAGEDAWVANDFDWPADAPMWLASGDLAEVK